MGLREDKRKLEKRREALVTVIAEKVEEREKAEAKIQSLEERDPSTEARRDVVDKKIEQLNGEVATLTERIRELRSRRSRLLRQIKKIVKKLRFRPRVKTLNLYVSNPGTRSSDNTSVGHHTGGPWAETDDEAERWFYIYNNAHKAKGWSGLGYHVGLGPEGTIFILRPGNYYGAHTIGSNHRTGIVVNGTIGDKPTKAQKRSLRYLLSHPQLVKQSSLSGKLYKHKDLNATACPGTFSEFYDSRGR